MDVVNVEGLRLLIRDEVLGVARLVSGDLTGPPGDEAYGIAKDEAHAWRERAEENRITRRSACRTHDVRRADHRRSWRRGGKVDCLWFEYGKALCLPRSGEIAAAFRLVRSNDAGSCTCQRRDNTAHAACTAAERAKSHRISGEATGRADRISLAYNSGRRRRGCEVDRLNIIDIEDLSRLNSRQVERVARLICGHTTRSSRIQTDCISQDEADGRCK